jgi:hypothetical protein
MKDERKKESIRKKNSRKRSEDLLLVSVVLLVGFVDECKTQLYGAELNT